MVRLGLAWMVQVWFICTITFAVFAQIITNFTTPLAFGKNAMSLNVVLFAQTLFSQKR